MKFSEFKRPSIPEMTVSLLAGILSVLAFILFFSYAIDINGERGLKAVDIAFDDRQDGLYFNARAFIVYLMPLIGGLIIFLPLKSRSSAFIGAGLCIVGGLVQLLMKQIYFSGLSDETLNLVDKSRYSLTYLVYISTAECLIAGALGIFKGFCDKIFKKAQHDNIDNRVSHL